MIKGFIKKNLDTILSIIPYSVLRKLTGIDPSVPFYHIVSDENVPHVKQLYPYPNVKEFREDMDFFLRNYSPISLRDLMDSLKGDRRLPKNPFLLTFDDGLREMYDIVSPVLKEKGIPATFFLATDFLDNKQLFYRHKASILIEHFQRSSELSHLDKIRGIFLRNRIEFTDFKATVLSVNYQRKYILDEIASVLNIDFNDYLVKHQPYLNSGQVKQLIQDGFTIGAHSLDHPMYASLALKDQLYQTTESIRVLRERFSLDYSAFAFPFTDYGVSEKYFEKIFDSRIVDISFGTFGMVADIYPNSLQRFGMDKTSIPAKKLVALNYRERILRVIGGTNDIYKLRYRGYLRAAV